MRNIVRACRRLYLRSAEKILFATFVPIGDGGRNSPLLQRAFGADNLPQLLNGLFKMAIAIGAIVAVVRLVYAGFIYMTSDLPGNKGSAKTIIWDSIIGLFLLLGVWLILNQINPDILDLNAVRNITPIKTR
jgi:hypothetical protein